MCTGDKESKHDMRYEFHSGKDICKICKEEKISISELMLRSDMEESMRTEKEIRDELKKNLSIMRSSINSGLDENNHQHGMFIGGDAIKIARFAGRANMGKGMAKIIASSMAVAETNASMGKIVAAPTAGASGILPAVLIECGENQRGFDEETLINGLLTAGAIGCIIAENASIAGASGGCQAETGTAAAMGAAALAEMCKATPEEAFSAAAIAIKNCLGLVCDPVAGLVECPCIKRNAIASANAILSADLVLSGISSLIPFDEVVQAMANVGKSMHQDLRETARGGLAATNTAKELTKSLNKRRG